MNVFSAAYVLIIFSVCDVTKIQGGWFGKKNFNFDLNELPNDFDFDLNELPKEYDDLGTEVNGKNSDGSPSVKQMEETFLKYYEKGMFNWAEIRGPSKLDWRKWKNVCLNAWDSEEREGKYPYCHHDVYSSNETRFAVLCSSQSVEHIKVFIDLLGCHCQYRRQDTRICESKDDRTLFFIARVSADEYFILSVIPKTKSVRIDKHVTGRPLILTRNY